MLTHSLDPQFAETDALGHINNTTIPRWFEAARTPIFRLFTPDLDVRQWRLILARYDIEFHGELFFGQPVEVQTSVTRLGRSAFDVYQEVWQGGRKCASGTTVMVHFDHAKKCAEPLPEAIRTQLNEL